jgi:hypothetical protein
MSLPFPGVMHKIKWLVKEKHLEISSCLECEAMCGGWDSCMEGVDCHVILWWMICTNIVIQIITNQICWYYCTPRECQFHMRDLVSDMVWPLHLGFHYDWCPLAACFSTGSVYTSPWWQITWHPRVTTESNPFSMLTQPALINQVSWLINLVGVNNLGSTYP